MKRKCKVLWTQVYKDNIAEVHSLSDSLTNDLQSEVSVGPFCIGAGRTLFSQRIKEGLTEVSLWCSQRVSSREGLGAWGSTSLWPDKRREVEKQIYGEIRFNRLLIQLIPQNSTPHNPDLESEACPDKWTKSPGGCEAGRRPETGA